MENSRWAKMAILGVCVVLPAIAIGISNWEVFSDSFVIATILLIITVGVAAIFTALSGSAMPQVRRYCLIADLVIGIVLCVNLASHFVLSREVSAAKSALVEHRKDEDRDEARKNADLVRQTQLMEKQAELVEAQRKMLNADANRAYQVRQSGGRVSSAAPIVAPVPVPTVSLPSASLDAPDAKKKTLRPEEVIQDWANWLMFWAFADALVSVLSAMILMTVWQWDRNGNGIPDHLEGKEAFAKELDVDPK